MKFLFPALLCLLLVACETVAPEPKPGTADHQRWLHVQARENFAELKAQERARRGSVAPARVAAREEKVQPTSNQRGRAPMARMERRERAQPTSSRRRVVSNDTIYEPTAEGLAELREWEARKAREYQIYEAIEAKRLGKTPQTLTREERAWIRSRAN